MTHADLFAENYLRKVSAIQQNCEKRLKDFFLSYIFIVWFVASFLFTKILVKNFRNNIKSSPNNIDTIRSSQQYIIKCL